MGSTGRAISEVHSESRPNRVMNHGAPAATTGSAAPGGVEQAQRREVGERPLVRPRQGRVVGVQGGSVLDPLGLAGCGVPVGQRPERPLDPLAAERDVDRPRRPHAVARRHGDRPGEPTLVERHLTRALVGHHAQRGGPAHGAEHPVEAQRVTVDVHPLPAVRAGVALLDREEVGEVGRHVHAHRCADLARDRAAQLDLLAQHRRQLPPAHDEEPAAVDAGAGPPDEARRRAALLGHAQRFGLVAVDGEAEPAQDPGVADEQAVRQAGRHRTVPVGEAERLPREEHDPLLGIAERRGLGALEPRRRGGVPRAGRAGLIGHRPSIPLPGRSANGVWLRRSAPKVENG